MLEAEVLCGELGTEQMGPRQAVSVSSLSSVWVMVTVTAAQGQEAV